MTSEQKARKVAEEIADRIGLQYVAVPSRQDDLRQLLREMLPTSLLQFAQEQESELRELVVWLEKLYQDNTPSKDEIVALQMFKAANQHILAALIAKHSRKGPNP